MKETIERLAEVLSQVGVSCEEASKAADRLAAAAKEAEPYMLILAIRSNPGLSIFQKWRLIREIRKEHKAWKRRNARR